MNAQKITSYALAWNPKSRTGFIRLILEGGRQHNLTMPSAEDFNALAEVLRNQPAYLDAQGTIGTGWEPDGMPNN